MQKKNIIYPFDISLVQEILGDYLNSKNTEHRFRMYDYPLENQIFGMDIYQYLKKFYQLSLCESSYADIRKIYTIYEHKKCMKLRLKYMIDNHYIDEIDSILETYTILENTALTTCNLLLKYNITKNENILTKVLISIEKMETTERICLSELLIHLQKYV